MRGGLLIVVLAAAVTCRSVEAQWLDFPTPGIPRLANGKADLSAPVPRTAQGLPDLTGLWRGECIFGESCWARSLFFNLPARLGPGGIEMTQWAATVLRQRQARASADDPYGYCLPSGVPRTALYAPFKIVQTPGLTAILYETSIGLVFRQVFTDGRPLPKVTEPTRLGYSVGKWDGETFVIETTGFKDAGWLDVQGHPASDALQVTERLHRRDFGHIEWTITINDPKAYVRPWTIRSGMTFLPDTELLEAFCDDHQKTMEHRQVAPAPPEPPSPHLP